MDVSCVMLTWNSEKFVGKCLDSLIADLQGGGLSFEVFVVDNGSRDATGSIIRSFQKRHPGLIRPIWLDRNTGTTYSRNLALKQTRGRYVAILDSDLEFRNKGTIAALIKTLKIDEGIGLAAPKLLYPNGNLQKSTDFFPTLPRKFWRYLFLGQMEKRENKRSCYAKPHKVEYAISAVWLLKGEVLKTVGLLDESIFYAPEDVDYCLRLWKSGYKIIYNPQTEVVHHTQEISRGIRIGAGTFSHIKGLVYYFRKHGYFLRRPKF